MNVPPIGKAGCTVVRIINSQTTYEFSFSTYPYLPHRVSDLIKVTHLVGGKSVIILQFILLCMYLTSFVFCANLSDSVCLLMTVLCLYFVPLLSSLGMKKNLLDK